MCVICFANIFEIITTKIYIFLHKFCIFEKKILSYSVGFMIKKIRSFNIPRFGRIRKFGANCNAFIDLPVMFLCTRRNLYGSFLLGKDDTRFVRVHECFCMTSQCTLYSFTCHSDYSIFQHHAYFINLSFPNFNF